MGGDERCAVALRYYRKDRDDACQQLIWSPKVLSEKELVARRQNRLHEKSEMQVLTNMNPAELFSCPVCNTPNVAYDTHCLMQTCGVPLHIDVGSGSLTIQVVDVITSNDLSATTSINAPVNVCPTFTVESEKMKKSMLFHPMLNLLQQL